MTYAQMILRGHTWAAYSFDSPFSLSAISTELFARLLVKQLEQPAFIFACMQFQQVQQNQHTSSTYCRLYLLANKIEFDEQLTDFASWGAGEKDRVKAEVNPLGHLPVVTFSDRSRPEAISTLRYIARKVR